MITRFPGVIVLSPPVRPLLVRTVLVRPRLPVDLRTALARVRQGSGVDRKAAGLALARAGISVDLMRRPLAACSREVRRRVELAVALAHGGTVLIVDGWLHDIEERTARALADTLRQLAAIDTSVYVIGHGLDRFFPQPPAGLGPRIARSLLGPAAGSRSVLAW